MLINLIYLITFSRMKGCKAFSPKCLLLPVPFNASILVLMMLTSASIVPAQFSQHQFDNRQLKQPQPLFRPT